MRGQYSQAANKHMMKIGSSVDYVRNGGMRNVPVTKAMENLYAITAKFSGCVLLTSRAAYSYPPRRNSRITWWRHLPLFIPFPGPGTVPVLPEARDISCMPEIRADIMSHVSNNWQRFKCFTQHRFWAPYGN
ncbi:hypothetical protein AVEN_9600-1 [Araneus ventricosus]|uniref:Uncharacterized protein n=1 Tax=Araneus ventricosus TaxID=182803 RepID=A0A4Y2H845_ARAVE|nr:hypothetical protein AVEN_9600-1 [Araneus ventricosus]